MSIETEPIIEQVSSEAELQFNKLKGFLDPLDIWQNLYKYKIVEFFPSETDKENIEAYEPVTYEVYNIYVDTIVDGVVTFKDSECVLERSMRDTKLKMHDFSISTISSVTLDDESKVIKITFVDSNYILILY